MDKSIKAVAIGAIAQWVVPMAFTAAVGFGASLQSGGYEFEIQPLRLAVFTYLVLGCGAFLGGWVTADRAPHSPLAHAATLGALCGFLTMGIGMPGAVMQLQFLAALSLTLAGGWAQCALSRAPRDLHDPARG